MNWKGRSVYNHYQRVTCSSDESLRLLWVEWMCLMGCGERAQLELRDKTSLSVHWRRNGSDLGRAERRGSAKCWARLDHDVCQWAAGTRADTEPLRARLPALQSAGLRDAIAGVMRSASRVSIHQACISSSSSSSQAAAAAAVLAMQPSLRRATSRLPANDASLNTVTSSPAGRGAALLPSCRPRPTAGA